MENKNKKTTKSKVNLKHIIIILITIVVILILVAIITKTRKNNNTTENNNQENNEQELVGLIDMSATENAKIENGIKENTSEALSQERTIGDLKITDIRLLAEEGVSHFTATIVNESQNNFAGGVAKITFTKSDGSKHSELEIYLSEVKAGETNKINAATTADIINAYDFRIEIQ